MNVLCENIIFVRKILQWVVDLQLSHNCQVKLYDIIKLMAITKLSILIKPKNIYFKRFLIAMVFVYKVCQINYQH